MHFGVLGTVQVWTADGVPVTVAETKVRSLLAALLACQGQPVSVERLIDNLWGDDPPANPTSALQLKVSRLRHALKQAEPGGDDLVATYPPGYRLTLQPGQTDAETFAELTSRARQTRDARTRAAMLAEALALWRGPAFAEFADESFARSAAQRLEEQRLTALEAQAEARLELDECGMLVGELSDLVRQHPLRERLREIQMRALYRCGRPSEALASYAELRRQLAEELGLDPSPELTALQEAILQQDPTLSPAAPPAPARTNLPAPLTILVGRDQAVDEIRCLLAAGRLVTLTGPGGVGKTRLAIETGNRMVQDLPDGVWLVELAGTCRTGNGRDASAASPGVEEMARTVSASIGLRDDTSESGISLLPSERVADTLHGRRLLLVLDNCEHVIEPVAKLAERLLRAAPGLRILATSREPLALDGETVWPVPPLALPDPAASSADLAQSGAMQLFVQRVTAVSPRFTLNSDNADQVAELCRRLDGLPLALELAATRVPALGVHELVNRLDNRFQLLAAGRRDAPERQQTLRGLLDWSWDLLTEPDRIVLRRLAVHAGGCILPAAETVCAGDEIAPDTVIDVLSRLVDRSLVVVTETPDGPRYQLLETIAEYCLGRLSEAGELDRVRRLFHRYYLDLAKRAEPQMRGPEQHEWLDRVARENTNLCTALGGMIGENDATGALELVTSLVWCWFQLGRLSLARDLLQQALAADGEAPVSLRATAQAWQAGIELLTNVDGEDAARARAAATAFDDIDDPQARARARWFVDYAVYTSKNDRTRAAILHATTGILYQRGLDGVGIDELCAHAGITKETLYHHFGSKDGLIRAVLEARSDRVTRWLAQAADDAGDDPVRRLAAIFDALARWYADPDFRGCGIGNAAAQRHSDPATAIAARHLGRYLDLLIDIAARAGVADPAALGRQLLVLLQGATTVADLLSDPGAAAHARDAALALLRTTARRDDTALGNTARAPVTEPADARR